MNDKIQLNELIHLQNDAMNVLKILSSGASEWIIEKKIYKYNIEERLGKIEKYGLDVIIIIPVLVRILECKHAGFFPSLVGTIAIEIGKLHTDGLVTEHSFNAAVKGTQIKPDEIPRELEKRGYLKDNYILPSFRPFDPNFTFDLDDRFSAIKDKIKDVMLAVSKEYPCTAALVHLAEDAAFESVRGDIIFALAEMGHPASFPVLLSLAKNNNKEAGLALIKVAYRDVSELADLTVRGVAKDLWGEDLRNKVLGPITEIVPFLLSALQSESYSIDERRAIADLYSMMGRRRQSELEVFVAVLPILLDERIGSCPVSRVIAAGGEDSIEFLTRFLDQGTYPLNVIRRIIEIFGLLGHEAAEALPNLKKIPQKYPDTETLVAETTKIIEQAVMARNRDEKNEARQKAALRGSMYRATGPGTGADIAGIDELDEISELESAEDIGDMIEAGEPEAVHERMGEPEIPDEGEMDVLVKELDKHDLSLDSEETDSNLAISEISEGDDIDALLAEIDRQDAKSGADDNLEPVDKKEQGAIIAYEESILELDSEGELEIEEEIELTAVSEETDTDDDLADDDNFYNDPDEGSLVTYEEEIPEFEAEEDESPGDDELLLETIPADGVAGSDTNAQEVLTSEIDVEEEVPAVEMELDLSLPEETTQPATSTEPTYADESHSGNDNQNEEKQNEVDTEKKQEKAADVSLPDDFVLY